MAGETAQPRASAPAGRHSAGLPAGRETAQEPPPIASVGEAAAIDADGASTATSSAWSSWSNLWQVPTIAVSLILIIAAVRTTIQPASANDFEGVFHQVDQLMTAAQFETARSLLRDMIEPNLGEASQNERARFHATVADLLFCSQSAEGVTTESANKRIVEQYGQSTRLELPLSLTRIERLAATLMDLGDLAGARQRLAELDALIAGPNATAEGVEAVKATRNRVFRSLVDATLRRSDASSEEIAQMISDYRTGPELSAEDEVWSIARLAELRLGDGKPQDVVQMLLVEMRRLESHGQDQTARNFGDLYTLLGRAYFDLGDPDRSQGHLDKAMQMLPDSEPAYGEALAITGRIALSKGDSDIALEKFNVVVRDYVGTPCYLSGLLGHAEASSIVGDHEQAQADYAMLREALARAGLRRDVTPLLAAQSLCDRHDAALALGNLERAAGYAELAESFFKSEEVPLQVLIRQASTHRQLGDNALAQAKAAVAQTEGQSESSTPQSVEVHALANEHYQQAGEHYLRHANSQDAARLDDQEWATSLWLAADSFDRGGRVDQAIRYFLRYLDGGTVDDPRRAETLFRLGQAYQAQMNFELAIEFYEQLVADHPRSTHAADAHVPLSRCYLAVNRRPEAEQQLREVLSGARLLTPDAEDYRDALIELGTLHYNAQEYSQAIERFTEAMERYPTDSRRLEIMYRLADSYRDSAMKLGDRLKEPPPLPPSEQGRINVLRAEQLQRALDLFAQVCETFAAEPAPPASLAGVGAMEHDMLRRAHLYRADCAFHLGFYEQAIELYDRGARLYSTHASSMYALVQIVNCYNLLKDQERAGAAHRRALVRLKQLPDSAFDSSESLMDRAAWERWLDNSPVGATLSSAAGTG